MSAPLRRALAVIAVLAGLLLVYGGSAASACAKPAADVEVSGARHAAVALQVLSGGITGRAGDCAASADLADCAEEIGATCTPLRSADAGMVLTALLAGLAWTLVRRVRAAAPRAPGEGSGRTRCVGASALALACVSRT